MSILSHQSRLCLGFSGCALPHFGEWEWGCVPAGILTLESVKSVKQRFSESKKLYPTLLSMKGVYIVPSAGPISLMEAINGCQKTAEEPWWAVNAYHSGYRVLQSPRDLAADFVCAFGPRLIGPCSIKRNGLPLIYWVSRPSPKQMLYVKLLDIHLHE
jgi:hypothetical protein